MVGQALSLHQCQQRRAVLETPEQLEVRSLVDDGDASRVQTCVDAGASLVRHLHFAPLVWDGNGVDALGQRNLDHVIPLPHPLGVVGLVLLDPVVGQDLGHHGFRHGAPRLGDVITGHLLLHGLPKLCL
eukprot:5796049-Pyramimonas_sp.AAC.1